MGATTFKTVQTGDNAKHAFTAARDHAAYMYGHNGYTGSIAEKQSFIMIEDTVKSAREKLAKADNLSEEGRTYFSMRLDRAAESVDPGVIAQAIAEVLLGIDDTRVTNKSGPAGCIAMGNKTYLFFGWARE